MDFELSIWSAQWSLWLESAAVQTPIMTRVKRYYYCRLKCAKGGGVYAPRNPCDGMALLIR